MATNTFGLSRHIPEDVKREVRKRCGFGCVICGASIFEYEHFAPDFASATAHSSDGITLLCPQHHLMVTKRIIPKELVAAADISPKSIQIGFSRESHPWFLGLPDLKLGGKSLIRNCPIPLQVGGKNVIEFKIPEEGSNITRISASLIDSTGEQYLSIIDNEWIVHNGAWDFESRGPRYIFRNGEGNIMLQLRMDAPKLIDIEILKTTVGDLIIDATSEYLKIGSNTFQDILTSNCSVGISIG